MITTAYIYYFDKRICKITYIENDICDFDYIFEPDYKIIDTLNNFHGIQGINLSLRKKEYIRHNMLPTFIFEHSPLAGKKSFNKAHRIDGLTLLEYLSKSPLQYFGDNLSIRAI